MSSDLGVDGMLAARSLREVGVACKDVELASSEAWRQWEGHHG